VIAFGAGEVFEGKESRNAVEKDQNQDNSDVPEQPLAWYLLFSNLIAVELLLHSLTTINKLMPPFQI
jgi:hypothetical protein